VLLAACAAPLGLHSVARDSPGPDHRAQITAPVLRLEVNLPAFRVDVWSDTGRLRSYRIAVGARRFRTPTGEFELRRIVWNPWWVPPASDWAKDEKVTPPGSDNPMGRVKLYFGPMYYLHGTPSRSSIGTAASHGCLRMLDEDAIELAQLVQTVTGAAITAEGVDSLLDDRRETREVMVPQKVAVQIVYRLAEVRGDTVLVHPDIYRTRAWSSVRALTLDALYQAGIDTSAVDALELRTLLRTGRTREARVTIDSLVPRPWLRPANREMPEAR
jgi:murein L,D-transpeptidase YcbB/YkuD